MSSTPDRVRSSTTSRVPDCPFVSLFQTGRFLDAERLVAASAPAAEDCSLDGGAEIWLMDLATGDKGTRL